MRKILIITMLLIAEWAFCQFGDKQLYMAYMASDLTLWGQYIDAQDWAHLSHAERKRLINYEYGYIPVLADQKRMDEAARYLVQYQAHLADEQKALTRCEYLTYLSAAHAYCYLLDKGKILSDGMQSFKLAKQAVEADPNDPIAMTLKGNVDFYAPKLFGGNKQKAIQLFLQAEKIMNRQPEIYRYMWNLPAIQLTIAQCYEKTGDLDAALQQAELTLCQHPDFQYLRDTYLPQLRQKKSAIK